MLRVLRNCIKCPLRAASEWTKGLVPSVFAAAFDSYLDMTTSADVIQILALVHEVDFPRYRNTARFRVPGFVSTLWVWTMVANNKFCVLF